ncbi:N-6 DNA methylase [Salisediminibacterium beveridgei]|uniref:site-specific DNA-methyltransferase (adenine-specific) n=1 Tax=Salisediminibacterium beveridgei TaxID=632773 RepID=A0A1D7QZN4_9BACI|nr:N-6 DNA methylase [Salisediminibacterium beveridgei]AOM84474.1 hypothetical protein BBEV_3158 [Salisediminibacterium beveridgei]
MYAGPEMELKLKKVHDLKEQGIVIVKDEVRSSPTSNLKADLIGYTIDEDGELIPQVVVEIKDSVTKGSQQQLMKLTEAIPVPYALLVTPEKQVWFETDTFLQAEPPIFNSSREYINSEKFQKDLLWQIVDRLRGEFRPEKTWIYIVQGMLVRSYMEEMSSLHEWLDLKEDDYQDLVDEAFQYYQIDLLPEKTNVNKLSFELFKWKLGEVRHKDSKHADSLISLSEINEYDGNHRTASSVRDLFVGLINVLKLSDYSVLEMCAGYGRITSGLLQQKDEIGSYFGMELNEYVANYHKMLMIISGHEHIKVKQGDVLDRDHELPNQQDLVIIDPPLGFRLPPRRYTGYELNKKAIQALDLMLERATEILKPEGYIICFVNEAFLYQGTSENTRSLLLDRMVIEAIISLPTHTLKPLTSIKVGVLVLRKKKQDEKEPKNLFAADCETIDEFTEAVQGFEKWKKGEEL